MASKVGEGSAAVEQENVLARLFLDLEKVNDSLFRSESLWKHSLAPSVYGGYTIGQALVVASYGVPEGYHIHSLHSYFLKGGKEGIPVLYHVEKTQDGKTYCSRSVKVEQSGTVIFILQASFKREESISTVHQLDLPKVPHPDQLETITEVLDRYRDEHSISESVYISSKEWYSVFPATTKLVEPEHLLLQRKFYPKRHLWIKAKGHIDESLHQNIHKCYLAYFSDSFVLQTALLCFSPFSDTSSINYASLDHSMWFHAPCRVDQWLLFQLETHYLGDGRALCRGTVWDIAGNLILTVVQEGVMRLNKITSKL